MNTITELFDLEDADIFISNISIDGNLKTITLETQPTIHFCPICGFRMHSKGVRTRTINHPVLQDSYRLLIKLKQRRWLVLMNHSSIVYHSDLRMDKVLHRMMNTYDYEDSLFSIDPSLRKLRDLKELYVTFNIRNTGKPMDARIELDTLIDRHLHCSEPIFYDFANLLIRYHDPIINSFIMVKRYGPGRIYSSRLSNGPIESLNRKVKDLKRLGRGYRNFDHFRNRFLYSTRYNPVINGMDDFNPVTYYEED